MFYCLAASKEGFLNGCRPFIGLDGCFIKLTTGQQILAATGRDGNNNIYPIAFGVVDKEDEESWTWFLTQLRCCIGSGNKFGTYTIISGRQKGLLKAINEVFPDSPQRFCLRHIYANFQAAGYRSKELKHCVDQASYSYTRHGHELGMAALKAQSEDAWKWLKNIEISAWARYAMDHTCKTDLVVNNLSEVFNKMILDVRAKPIRTMFEGIRTKQMIKRQQTRGKLQTCRWTITPNYSEILEENKKYAKHCQADKAGETIWQVTSKENQYCVDMETCTCDCKRWDMTGCPCSHAISALIKQKLHPEDYVNEFFKKPLYLEAYKAIIFPVPGPDCWPDTNTPDIQPPVFKEKAGKKQTARRKGEFEVPAPRDTSRMGTITCGNCNKTLRPRLQMRKTGHQENRAVYEDIAGSSRTVPLATARTTTVPAATPSASAPAPSASGPGPSASAPGPAPRAKRGRPKGRGRTRGFTAPRPASTSDNQVGTKRKRMTSSKLKGYFYCSGNY
ncbi:uncharacterized protein LOC119289171 [Triticum dicoccoides]|uniref:uncharacterized protein LOC119289171 n=1 Tax=Triticum dicoccoides TaxID=85692 RepID=UPI0018905DC2|nr:uncharacterized protein LOC119289171 [Triticum dicoccoides]